MYFRAGVYGGSVHLLFALCYRFASNATQLNPGAPCQIALYASHLQYSELASNAHRQLGEIPSAIVEMELQSTRKGSKDFELFRLAWKYNDIWYSICVAKCVFSRSSLDLFGYDRRGFDPEKHYEESLSGTSESSAEASAAAKAPHSLIQCSQRN